MTAADEPADATVSPDDAFAVLGNETRMQIVRVLAEADEPLAFSDLHDAVDVRDSGQFNYTSTNSRGTSSARPTTSTSSGRPGTASSKPSSPAR